MSPRFQRLRSIRAFEWLFTCRFSWTAVIIVIILNCGYSQLAPHIVSVPIVRQGGEATT